MGFRRQMKMIGQSVLVGILISASMSPLATAQPSQRTIRVLSSPDVVSTLTEIPGTDYLIPDSQVFVGGKDGASRWLALLGIAIDTTRNQSTIGEAAESVRLKFDTIVARSLAARTGGAVTFEAAAGEPYNVKLLPSARFLVDSDQKVHLSFRLTARIRDDITKRESTKNYHYALSEFRPFSGNGGWTENNAQIVRERASVALDRLLEAFSRDMAGDFVEPYIPEKRRIIKISGVQGGPAASVLLLGQTSDTVIVMSVVGGRPLFLIVQVIERASVRIEGLEK